MKNQRGVTALSMMIVIVVIVLIASFSLFTSRDVVVETNIAKIKTEIKTIKEQVDGISLDEDYFSGVLSSTKISNISEYNARVGDNLKAGKEYYYLGFADETTSDVMIQTLNEVLGVRSVENSYIIAIEDVGEVEVYLVDGVRVEDKTYYSYEEIKEINSDVTQN